MMRYLCKNFILILMKKLSFILFSLLSNIAFGQFIENISFSELPQDFQLFPRDANRNAIIPLKGTVLNRWKTVSVVVFREGKIYTYQKAKINAPANNFNLTPVIKAEKSEYSFKIYASDNDKDSTFIIEKKNLVAGDFYVIYGDSNGNTQGVVTYYPTNKYIRTFGTFNQDAQAAGYLGKDTTWSVNENYFQPKVGAWGTNLQELIASKYDIPVCVITGGGPGMYMDLLSDRTGNPFSTGGVYNTFAYRVKKSGLIDHIKGFFFWHGVYELFSRTDVVEYDKKLKKLMGFFQQDFPKTKQFYVFQNDMVSFNIVPIGTDIRESQRKMASVFPNTTPYAAMGLKGSDGVHYTLDGYQKLAEEMLQILEPQFYGKPANVNNFSPNVQKVFFTDASHKAIKLVFQEGQNIVLGNDTTVRSSGNNYNLSLKKYFYPDDNILQNIDIQTIKQEENTILLQANGLINAKTLSYLPPYHTLFAPDYPVFMGPFIKNNSGARALTFGKIKIQEPLSVISNLTSKSTTTDIKLTWSKPNIIAQNAHIILERKAEKEANFKKITTLKNDVSEFQDVSLTSGTTYNYRLKIVADSSESDYAQITASTLAGLGKPNLKSTVLYNNKVQLDWTLPTGADKFQVAWRPFSSKQYTNFTTSNSSNNLIFDGLKPAERYVFKIESSRNLTNETTSDSVIVTMPALLTSPELSSTVLFYNSLKINWKPILGATSYILERKTTTENYKQIASLDSKTTEWLEKDLKENTTYTYRLKAFGDKTESLESTISVNTSAVLATPELTADQITHESVRVKWKAIPNATKYILERQAENETSFTKILETNALLENIDLKLKSNLKYTYRLKAFSDVSESNFGSVEVKTLVILANQEEENSKFKVYPNPAKNELNISFSEVFTGEISLVDILGRSFSEMKLSKQKSVLMDVSGLERGVYFLRIKGEKEIYSRKVLIL
jgi:Secretion system C-terminal sorting domain/Carbohydrate esterase, sialic acid-specific acetylesterase/Fibronectin type III domain